MSGSGLTTADRLQAAVVRGLSALPDPLIRLIVGRPISRDGQQLHPETQLALRLLSLAGAPDLDKLTVAEARARVAHDALAFQGKRIQLPEVRDLEVSGAFGPLAARLYVPDDSGAEGAVVVYFHGGGFVVGDLDTHDNTCRFLARCSGARVLAVDYRLAPEFPFPAPAEDALAAFRFTAEHCSELGGDPARIGVAGDSAGGNLAALVAQLSVADGGPSPAFQLLFYPWLDLVNKRESHRLFGEGFYLTESDLEWYGRHYLAGGGDPADPRCSPALGEPSGQLPPAYIATAGFDPLRDEGEEYAASLRARGVPVALRRHAGLIHGFVNTVSIGHVGREAVLEAAGALRLALAPR